MRPVPVLLMSEQLGAGGSEAQLAQTALRLDRSRFEPHVVCLKPGFRGETLREAGVTVTVLRLSSFRSPRAAAAAWRLGRYLRRHRIAVFHAFDYPAACFGVPVARVAGVPVVLSSQRADRGLTPPLYRSIQRLTDRMVDGVVVNCLAMQRHMELEGVRAERLHLCYNGLDPDQYHPGPRKLPAAIEGASVVVGTVGVLRAEKDIRTLLEAFAVVAGEAAGARLAVVGSGPTRNELGIAAERLGIARQVHFEPATSRPGEWLRAMDVFVLPSLSEAFSNSLMEAMASGCAVVVSRTGGNPELVREGTTGMLFEPGDSAELACLLRLLIGDAALRERLGKAAAEFIRSRFTAAAAADRMAAIYSGLLARRMKYDGDSCLLQS